MEKEAYKLDISYSNTKNIVDHFIRLYNKYIWLCLVSIV